MLYKKLARYLFTLGSLLGLLFLTILVAFLAHSHNYLVGKEIFRFLVVSGLFLCMIFGIVYLRLLYILKTQVAAPLQKALQVLKDHGIPLSSLDNEAEVLYAAVQKAGKILSIDRVRQTIYPFWNRVFDEDEVLNGTLRLFGETGHILCGAFYRYDSFKDQLVLQASYAFPEEGQKVLSYGEGPIGEAAARNKTVVLRAPDLSIPVGLGSLKPSLLCCLPVATQKLYGVLVVALPPQAGEDQLGSMEIVAAQLGIVLDRVHQLEDLKKMMEELNERTISLNRELKHMNSILNNSADGIIIINDQGKITSFSRGAEDITGYKASEVIGKECSQVLKHHSQEFEHLCGTFLCAFCQVAKEKTPVVGKEVYLVHKNGNYVPVLLTSTPIFDDEGNLIEVLQIFKDLTEIKNNLTKLEEANRSKTEFLATMSHELRTPLNAILGFTELLETENFGPLNEKQKRFIANIHLAGKHLLSLINDILDISRVESGKMEWEQELIDLPSLFRGAVNLLKEKAAQNRISIHLNLEPGVGEFVGDERKIKQITYNLLSNAVKFTPEGGEVGVNVRKAGKILEVEVWDTGIGIPPEKREAIFEPFYQVDNSLTRKHQGSGLGLALVKKMVTLAGGRVWVEDAPGKSTVFKFTIPEHGSASQNDLPAQEPAEEQAEQAEDVSSSEKLCILIEDDPRTAELLETYLSELGLKVKVAASGEEGLGLVSLLKPELVVLDILLPGISGWEVLTQLKSSADLCSIPVLVVSILEEKKKGLALGARDYLVKPVDKGLLKICVERILQRREKSYKALVIDDDLRAVQHMEKHLQVINFKVFTALDGREGLKKAQEIKPDIILLDLMMPQMDGFEFLRNKEKDEAIASIPVVVVTSKTITPEERRFLEERALYIARKSDFGKEDFVNKVLELLEEGEASARSVSSRG